MQARDAKMKTLKSEVSCVSPLRVLIRRCCDAQVQKKLLSVSQNPKYNELLRFLIAQVCLVHLLTVLIPWVIAQGLLGMQEEKVVLQCRQEDEALVKVLSLPVQRC